MGDTPCHREMEYAIHGQTQIKEMDIVFPFIQCRRALSSSKYQWFHLNHFSVLQICGKAKVSLRVWLCTRKRERERDSSYIDTYFKWKWLQERSCQLENLMKMARTQLSSWEPTRDSSAILKAYFLLGKWTFYRTCRIWQTRWYVKLWELGREAGYFLQLYFKSQKGKNTTYSGNEIHVLIIEWKIKCFCRPQRRIHEIASTSLKHLREMS